jgi:hypothetical protein
MGGPVSRSHDARRKAKRQTARAEAESGADRGPKRLRVTMLLPFLVIAAILAGTALIGFGGGSHTMSPAEAQVRVASLLADVPQHGNALGSPDAPLTLELFADLECPTVKKFAETYLPTLVDTWVRPGALRIEYRPLETDTTDEKTFFAQEEATLAAGHQGRLWNYALTFLYEQGPDYTGYADQQFFEGIAAQVPQMNLAPWRHARPDPRLTAEVIDSVSFAHSHETRFTPSFYIGLTPKDEKGRSVGLVDSSAARRGIVSFLESASTSLEQEVGKDAPTLRAFNSLGGSG